GSHLTGFGCLTPSPRRSPQGSSPVCDRLLP
ncbi:MAG: hypothetical protein ACI8RZ_005384, partial [Myxococcota bacterium]